MLFHNSFLFVYLGLISLVFAGGYRLEGLNGNCGNGSTEMSSVGCMPKLSCYSNRCKALAGAACTRDTDCHPNMSLKCTSGFCAKSTGNIDMEALRRELGEKCNQLSKFIGNTCKKGLSCKDGYCVEESDSVDGMRRNVTEELNLSGKTRPLFSKLNQKCRGKGVLSLKCGHGLECSSTQTTGVCKVAPGEACETDRDCLPSNVCNDNICGQKGTGGQQTVLEGETSGFDGKPNLGSNLGPLNELTDSTDSSHKCNGIRVRCLPGLD